MNVECGRGVGCSRHLEVERRIQRGRRAADVVVEAGRIEVAGGVSRLAAGCVAGAVAVKDLNHRVQQGWACARGHGLNMHDVSWAGQRDQLVIVVIGRHRGGSGRVDIRTDRGRCAFIAHWGGCGDSVVASYRLGYTKTHAAGEARWWY